ncbi:MAG: hypothetical protein PHV05_11085 [Candidatus Riflebacteria bacterium]|nr:hypothetical protein [Candidatus Riflebacteria bacterium]
MAGEELCRTFEMRGDLMTGQGKTRETKNESRTGHGNASKIDFLFDAYYVVARYIRAGRNWEMRFQTIKVGSGLVQQLLSVTSSNYDQ